MNKKLILIGIILIFVCVGLSGCNERQSLSDTDEVELVSYSVVTRDEQGNKIGDGFVHHDDANRYRVTGTVKNIAGRNLDRITITARFYDKDNEFLHSENATVWNLTKGNTDEFSISYYCFEKYFEVAESVSLHFEVP